MIKNSFHFEETNDYLEKKYHTLLYLFKVSGFMDVWEDLNQIFEIETSPLDFGDGGLEGLYQMLWSNFQGTDAYWKNEIESDDIKELALSALKSAGLIVSKMFDKMVELGFNMKDKNSLHKVIPDFYLDVKSRLTNNFNGDDGFISLNAADKDTINRLIQKRKNNQRKPMTDRSIGFLDKEEKKEQKKVTLDNLFKSRVNEEDPEEVIEEQVIPENPSRKKRLTLDDLFKGKADENYEDDRSSSSMKNIHNLNPEQKKKIMNEWWG